MKVDQSSLQSQNSQQIYNMTTAAHEFELLKQHMRRQEARKHQNLKIRTINTIKWKQLILHNLEKLKSNPQFDLNLLDDIRMVVSKIAEETFIQAIINMQPLKPNFIASTYTRKTHNLPKKGQLHKKFKLSPGKDGNQQSTTASSILKQSSYEQKSASKKMKDTYEHFTTMVEQETLRKQLSGSYHPFSKIIDGITFLLQNKYKIVIQKMEREEGCVIMQILIKKIESDVKLIESLLKNASKPIVEIFCSERGSEKSKFQEDFDNFIVNFLRNNEKYCLTLRKIVRYASKKSIETIQFNHFSTDSAEIDSFQIPKDFRIEGLYLHTTGALIELIQTIKGKKCLEKLTSIRKSFYRDINEYQQNKGGQILQVNSEIQMQIFKYLLTKLKIFSDEIFAQLKYLELLYGQEEIGFQYEDASFMHSQLLISFQAIRLKL